MINGVLMGLSKREARARLDAVLDFAELEDFAELKLKNYSSGMMVRLAFAVMVQADADIMLVDEVLAVGDVAFAQKCMDVFHERRRRRQDDRAGDPRHGRDPVALPPGDADARTAASTYIGDPEETAMRYYRLNFAGGGREARAARARRGSALPDINARKLEARWMHDRPGSRIENVAQGDADPRWTSLIEARRELAAADLHDPRA